MSRKSLAICVAVLGIIGGVVAVGRQEQESVIVPRDISVELSKLQSISDKLMVPENVEAEERARSIFERTRLAWAESQRLVNSGNISIGTLRHMYLAEYRPAAQEGGFSYVFRSKAGEIRQCTKWTKFPEGNQVGQREYEILFDEVGGIRSCEFKARNERIRFYPSGLVRRIYFETADGSAHTLTWREDGSFDVHRSIKKADFPKFFRGDSNTKISG